MTIPLEILGIVIGFLLMQAAGIAVWFTKSLSRIDRRLTRMEMAMSLKWGIDLSSEDSTTFKHKGKL